MQNEPSGDIYDRYELASTWRPEMRSRLLANVVERVICDAESDGGYAIINDHGSTRTVAFDVSTGTITGIDTPDINAIWPLNHRSSSSPDGNHELEVRDHNLWLNSKAQSIELELTTDGSPDHAYGMGRQPMPGSNLGDLVAIWSPDSRFVVTQRLDLRDVREHHVVESCPRDGGPPKLHSFRDSFPGDEHVPHVEIIVIDTQSGKLARPDLDPIPATHTSPLLRRDVWWSASANRLYVVLSTRDWQELSLVTIDPTTGAAKTLVHEMSHKRIRPNLEFHQAPCVAVNDSKGAPSEVVWFSERDGWGHLYLYDAQTGECVRQITGGKLAIASIHRVDWEQRTIWASAAGLTSADPYRESICRINIDSGDLTRLTNDDLDHRVLMVPADPATHSWFFDIASTVSDPCQFIIRDWDGRVLVDLGTMDTSEMEASGWRAPERFRATAADGETDVYGTLFYPPHFDPGASYPVIDHVYPGPQTHRSVPWFQADEIEPYVALGMVGVTVDGRGTPGRDRAFYDASWRNVGAGSGLEDHVVAIQELAVARPWLDAENVAIHGRSAGGFATARAMELFPDFYKVGIAAAGRFEGRMVMAMIMEAYDDPYNMESWKRASAVEAADQITGKFLIVHGEMDVACTIYHAYRLIDRMIEANRDFDLLIVPGDDHPFTQRGNYVERRIWDYLTEHLLGKTPPKGYEIRG